MDRPLVARFARVIWADQNARIDGRDRNVLSRARARACAGVFPKSINMLIRLLPRKLNARRRQGLKGILIQGHRD